MTQQHDVWLRKQAAQKIGPPRSDSAFEADVKAGRFPPYVKIGQVRYWLESEVKAYAFELRERQMRERAEEAAKRKLETDHPQ